MKTIMAVLAGAAILAAPFAASAQSPLRGRGDHRDPGQFTGRSAAPAVQAPPAEASERPRGERGAVQGEGARRRDEAVQPDRNVQRGGGDRNVQRGDTGRNQQRFDRGDDRRGGDRNVQRDDNRRNDQRFDRGDNRRFDRGDNRRFDRGYARGGVNLRGYRPHSRSAYAGAYRSRSWGLGGFLPGAYWNSYVDPFAYDLPAAPWGTHWVLVRDEALLIEDGSGAIIDVIPLY